MTEPIPLAPGVALLGRGRRCDVRIDDPRLEPHHVRIELSAGGALQITQLAGRVPMRIADRACRAWAGGPEDLSGVIELGTTRLVIEPMPSGLAPRPPRLVGDRTGARLVIRPPRQPSPDPLQPADTPLPANGHEDVDLPVPAAGGGGLIAAVITLGAAATMAVVMGQALFMLFAVTGALATFSTWVWGRWRHRRERRRARDRALVAAAEARRIDEARHDALRRAHLERYRVVADALGDRHSDRLWARRSSHGDAFCAVLGHSALDSAGVGSAITVGTDLASQPVSILAVTGEYAAPVIRSIVVQLAINTGPADWAMAEFCGAAVGAPISTVIHRWALPLPHHLGVLCPGVDEIGFADRCEALIAAGRAGRRIVIVVGDAELLSTRTSPLRRLIDTLAQSPESIGVTVVVEATDPATVPSVCTAVLHTGIGALGRWCHGADSDRLRVCGISESVASAVAADLERLGDPEQLCGVGDALVDTVGLEQLEGVPHDVDSVLAAWASNTEPAAPIGLGIADDRTADVVWLNLVTDGPHGLIAGTTGSGKSELLRTLVISLAARVSPRHLNFVLVDYKGGATFDACATLPHTVGMVTDLDGGLAARALASLNAELHRREVLLRACGAVDVDTIDPRSHEPIPRLLVVIDEFAALAGDVPGFITSLVGVAQRGRSLGVHLLLATQRPAGVIDDAIRANTDLRLALRLNDRSDALDVVGDPAPAGFSRSTPGRALLRLGADTERVFQTATSGHRHGSGTLLESLARAIAAAAERSHLAAPHRPWLASLDTLVPGDLGRLVTADAGADAIGLIDDPAHQRYLPLRWGRNANLAIIGSLGSGTSSALAAVMGSVGLDAAAMVLVAADPGVFGADRRIIGLGETERIGRVLTEWCREIDRRRAECCGSHAETRVLAIDGLAALRRSLDGAGPAAPGAGSWELVDRILTEGPAVGVFAVVVIEDQGVRSASLVSRFSERWVMRLGDAADGPIYGVPAHSVPEPGAAAGSLVVFSSGLSARVLLERPEVVRTLPATELAMVPTLASSLDRADLAMRDGRGPLPIGRRFDDLGIAHLDVGSGDHALVVGPARSGRTTALVTLAMAWAAQHPEAPIAVVGDAVCAALGAVWTVSQVAARGRGAARCIAEAARESIDEHDRDQRTARLVVIDDAERIDDPDGELQRLCEQIADAGGSVFAAARADVLRQAYGHWTSVLRRDRRGLVMAATGDHDSEVLGEAPPRRCPIPPRPGLGWMIGSGPPSLVQIAGELTSTTR